jgi:hypothetical protein
VTGSLPPEPPPPAPIVPRPRPRPAGAAGPPVGVPDRRRPGWREFRRAYPGIVTVMWLMLVGFLVAIGLLVRKRAEYRTETARLRKGMSAVERHSADLELENHEKVLRVMVELARRQAQGDRELHLAIAVDSGVMSLEREGALLREMPVRVSAERRVGVAPDTVRMAAPRGSRTIERILTTDSVWTIPRWVYTDRGLPVDSVRQRAGALGEGAIVLSGGTVIYGDPAVGPLADSGYVMPGSVRARGADLRAIAPDLKPGINVYLY